MTSNADDQLNIIAKLSALEESIGRLYGAYANSFPDYNEFWTNLASDERQHAAWIGRLYSLIDNNSITFSKGRFKLAAIQTFLKYLDDELIKAKAKNLSLMNALSITLYIEESLIELKYFEMVEGDTPELKRIFRDLASATQMHVAKVREVLNRYKSNTGS